MTEEAKHTPGPWMAAQEAGTKRAALDKAVQS